MKPSQKLFMVGAISAALAYLHGFVGALTGRAGDAYLSAWSWGMAICLCVVAVLASLLGARALFDEGEGVS